MLAPVTVLVGFGLVTNVAAVVPHHDMGPTCRAAVNLVAGGGEGRTVEGCLAGEEKAQRGGKDSEHGAKPVHFYHG